MFKKAYRTRWLVGACLGFLLNGCSSTGMYLAAGLSNSRISTYLQLEDQYGEPLHGAIVDVNVVGSGSMAPGKGDGEYISDVQGLVHIEGSGRSVTVRSIKHPDISPFLMFNNRGGYQRSFYLSSSGQNAAGAWTVHTTSSNPFKVSVWRVNKFSDVVAKDIRVYIPVNEGLNYVSIGRDGKWQVERELNELSLFGFSCHRVDSGVNRYDVKSWSLNIVAVNGGLQEQSDNDNYSNLAPEDGYLGSLSLYPRKSDNLPHQSSEFTRAYFFEVEKNLYGAFLLKVDSFHRDGNFCKVYGGVKYLKEGGRDLSIKDGCMDCSYPL